MSLREYFNTPDDQPFPPITVGAGLNKNFHQPDNLRRYSEMAASMGGGVVIGSITVEPRPGNQGELLQSEINGTSQNAWGMPNDGLAAMPESAPHDNLIVSVAGFSVQEYLQLYDALWSWGLGVELNLGCPNTGEGKDILSFDIKAIGSILSEIQAQRRSSSSKRNQLLGLKLSPYSNPAELKRVASAISSFTGTVDYVVASNTFPNARAYDPQTGKLAIQNESTDNMGGLGGRAMKDQSLGQARQFRKAFADYGASVEVVRCGGVEGGIDVWASQQDELDGVQVVTAAEDNFHFAGRMMMEYDAMSMTYSKS